MNYQHIFNSIKSSSSKQQFPIQTLELVNGDTITLIQVGLTMEGTDCYPVHIEDIGNGCFRIYAVDSSGGVFLLEEITASISTSIFKTYFKNEQEIAEAMFHKFITEGSTDVKYLQRFSTWVARDDQGDMLILGDQTEIESLINRNEGHFAVVCKDAFDRETKFERFVTGNFSSEKAAILKAEDMNKAVDQNITGDFFEVVKLPYKLFTPDF